MMPKRLYEKFKSHPDIVSVILADAVGENVAYGYTTPEGVVSGWMQSAGHRRILMDPKWNYIGIAKTLDDKNRAWYCTLFITK